MGVASLISECDQLGVLVDISKLTRESSGLTVDQVLELRLERLLLTRKLEISVECRAVEAVDVKNQLEQVSKKLMEKENEIASQRQEIKNLRAKIEKNEESLEGEPGVKMESTEADDDDDLDTVVWAADKIGSLAGREDGNGKSKQTGSTLPLELEEESARVHHDSQDNDDCDGVIVNGSTSTSGCAEPDLTLQPRAMSVCSVNSRRDDYEDSGVQKTQGIDENEKDEDSSSKSDDDILIPESQENPRNEGGSIEDTILQSEASSPAHQLRQNRRPAIPLRDLDSSSDIGSPPDSQSDLEESGSPKAKTITTTIYKPFRCPRCPKQFKAKWDLNCHLFKVHSNDPGLFKCGRCCLAYISEDELNRHKVQCRLKNRESSHFKCRYCSKLFNCKSTCARHQRMHLVKDGKDRPKCETCHTSFARLGALTRHNKRFHSLQK